MLINWKVDPGVEASINKIYWVLKSRHCANILKKGIIRQGNNLQNFV